MLKHQFMKFRAADAQKFVHHVVPHVVRPARIIWNQAIGSVFLVLAITAFANAWGSYKLLASDSQSGGRMLVALVFGAVMAAFGLSSFWRARRISRSQPGAGGWRG
jgi:hypothetical protein